MDITIKVTEIQGKNPWQGLGEAAVEVFREENVWAVLKDSKSPDHTSHSVSLTLAREVAISTEYFSQRIMIAAHKRGVIILSNITFSFE